MKSNIPEIDVHNMTRLKAKEYIYERLEYYRKHQNYTIKIIHGFNNGNSIKTWLNSSEKIIKDLNINRIMSDPLNSGATYIYLNIKKND